MEGHLRDSTAPSAPSGPSIHGSTAGFTVQSYGSHHTHFQVLRQPDERLELFCKKTLINQSLRWHGRLGAHYWSGTATELKSKKDGKNRVFIQTGWPRIEELLLSPDFLLSKKGLKLEFSQSWWIPSLATIFFFLPDSSVCSSRPFMNQPVV